MNLNEYFADMDDQSRELDERIRGLVDVCKGMPAGSCMVVCFEAGEMRIVEHPREAAADFYKCESTAKQMATRGEAIFVLIKANGRLFLKVGAPYGNWLRAYKMPGHDVFVLEGKDGT